MLTSNQWWETQILFFFSIHEATFSCSIIHKVLLFTALFDLAVFMSDAIPDKWKEFVSPPDIQPWIFCLLSEYLTHYTKE